MRRLLFTILLAVSLGLSLASVAMWVRSFWRLDEIALIDSRKLPQGWQPAFPRTVRWEWQSEAGKWQFTFSDATLIGGHRLGKGRVTLSATSVARPTASTRIGPRPWSNHTVFAIGGLEFARRNDDLAVPRLIHYDHTRGFALLIPYWLTLVVVAAPLLLQIPRLRRAHRRRKGCCWTCGYDLRATPNRCPECGLVPATIFSKTATFGGNEKC